ncbi:MAG: ATP-dependent sacrificial sulfur transferase LarE [Deltaproteobacteria bacterium]|nr:ATP-dependent sacrificial sulfur transferase LarE [Deltaproteobacteria bacterium]
MHGTLASLGSVVVAFSGGVDSTLLLRAAASTSGLRVLALTTASPTNTADEVEEARRLADQIGVEHVVRSTDELDTPGYADNPAHRCYLCKQTLYPLCVDLARERGFAAVADGVNTDDLGDYRPGLRAAAEFGVRHPLVEANLDKNDVRALSRRFGLPTADRPASPCLSSRFPYGTRISHAALARVAAAEAALRRLGFVELRVRYYQAKARVEVAAVELPRLDDPAVRSRAQQEILDAGFGEVEFAREPLRSGSLNDALRAPRAQASRAPAPDRPLP